GQAGETVVDHVETRRVVLVRAREQELHAEADAEHGPRERRHDLGEARGGEPRHSRGRRADPGPDHRPRSAHPLGIFGHGRIHAEPLEREAERREIRPARANYDDVASHSGPFVDGSSPPRRAIAWRSARATPLKHTSTMWCAFSPRTRTWIAAPSVSASERKKCGTGAVRRSPTR